MTSVNGLNISDNSHYITSEVTCKQFPQRTIQSEQIATRPGNKLTATEWGPKEITIKGYIFDTTASGLLSRVDTLQQNFAIKALALQVDTNRTYTATLTALDIPTQFYNNTYVEYTATFISVDPFSYGPQITISGTVASGITTFSGTLSVSGTVFAEPQLRIIPKGAMAGNSGMKAIKVTYLPTGESVTTSGNPLHYFNPIVYGYNTFYVTISGVNSDFAGIFSRWEPGSNSYQITVTSGTPQAYDYVWSYSPRYYQ